MRQIRIINQIHDSQAGDAEDKLVVQINADQGGSCPDVSTCTSI